MERVPKELKTVTISGGDMFNNAVIEKLVAIIDGRCEQVTLDEDGIESNFIKIKGPDSAS
jgi:hypothetical protein